MLQFLVYNLFEILIGATKEIKTYLKICGKTKKIFFRIFLLFRILVYIWKFTFLLEPRKRWEVAWKYVEKLRRCIIKIVTGNLILNTN